MTNVTAAAWQACPAGLTVDPWSRFSGCTIGIDLARFLAWWGLIFWPSAGLLSLFTAAKLHLHDSASSPARVQGLIVLGIGCLSMAPFLGYVAIVPGPHTGTYSAISFALVLGVVAIGVGLWKYLLNHLLAGVFQMVYSLEQAKSKKWTRRMTLLSKPVGWGHGGGAFIAAVGCDFARDQKGTDMAVGAGLTVIICSFILASSVLFYGYLELHGLQKVIGADSSTGKALRKLSPFLLYLGIMVGNWAAMGLLCVAIPWLRHRAGTIYILLCSSGAPLVTVMCVYELQQLGKRKAAQKQQQRQIISTSKDSQKSALQTSSVADTVAATQQALLSGNRLRRNSSASLVLDAGVSLAFLETFVRENGIGETMTCNDAVNTHVKPCTEEIGLDGSGAFVELIGEGVDGDGRHWRGTPTHMLSYSWSYSMGMIVAGLQKFEREWPPSKGQCNYYFIDQVSSEFYVRHRLTHSPFHFESSRSISTSSPKTARRSRSRT
jgi:hypothetical protein